MTKSEIRASMRKEAATRCLPGRRCLHETEDLWRRVESLPEFGAAHTVLAFMSLPDEVPTGDFIDRWNGSKRIAIPRVMPDGSLELREYRCDCLREGYKGISEPTDSAPLIDAGEIDLALVPGVAFDRCGRRLGRGKGFYDRLLPQLHCPSVAICQPWRIIEEVPVDNGDVAIDIIP